MNKKMSLIAIVLVVALIGVVLMRNNIVINNVFDEYYYLRVSPEHQKILEIYGTDHSKFVSGIGLVNYGDREIGNKYITVDYRREILQDNMNLLIMLDPDDKNFEIIGRVYYNEEETEALSIRITYDVKTNKRVYSPIGIISKVFRDEGDSVGAHSAENITAFMEEYSIDQESISKYYQYFLDVIVEHWTSEGASQFTVDNWGKYSVKNRILVYLAE